MSGSLLSPVLAALLENLSTLQQDVDSTDVSLVCEDGEVRAHSIIIGARSPVFFKMMKHDMMEKKTGEVKIEEFTVATVQAMVTFIYTARMNEKISSPCLEELLKLGDKYDIPSLVEDCSNKLVLEITDETLFHLGSFAELYNARILMEECSRRVSENYELLSVGDWKKDTEKSPKFCLSIIQNHKHFHGKRNVRISWFSENYIGEWIYGNVNSDPIQFKTNIDTNLVDIVLFGTNIGISAKIAVKEIKDETVTLTVSFETRLVASRKSIPITFKLPSPVRIHAGRLYTVILDECYYNFMGEEGMEEVRDVEGSGLVVTFIDSAQSTGRTRIQGLVFQV
jgi:hypothetical protein